MSFVIEPLHTQDRNSFRCGIEALDRYLRERAAQDVRRRFTACYVARDVTNDAVAGFYTLAASGIPLTELPEALAHCLPRYPLVPVARVGRLAVALDYRKRRLGAALLWDALARTQRSEIAAYALAVDAKDEVAAAFYEHHGFLRLTEHPPSLFLPLAQVKHLLGAPE